MIGGSWMSMDDRTIYQDMTLDEKKKIIKDLKIIHPNFSKALKLIQKCHESLELSDDPQCMLISGPSGSGKTTIFDTYVKLNDKVEYDEKTGAKKSILWAEIPSPIRISTFLETMLERLGDPFPTRGNIGNKNHRLVNLIKDCGIELIMLDEFQHFVHPENQTINYDVADCFKSLVNRTKVPVVLFGLEDSVKVINANQQLNRRFSMRTSLAPFGIENNERKKEFQKLLTLIDTKLPFTKIADLGSCEMVGKIHFATDGFINSVMKIIREAAFSAVEKNKNSIELIDFAKAYHIHSHILKGADNNPFLGSGNGSKVTITNVAN